MLKKSLFLLVFLCFITPIYADYWDYLTKPYADSLYCAIGTCGGGSDASWYGNYTSMIIDCAAGEYVYGMELNGDWKCGIPAGGSGSVDWSDTQNYTGTVCAAGEYVYGFFQDGTPKCRTDQIGNGTGSTVCTAQSYIGTDLSGSSGDLNRVLTINRTVTLEDVITVDNFYLYYVVDYTTSVNQITFLNEMWDDSIIYIWKCASNSSGGGGGGTTITGIGNMTGSGIAGKIAMWYNSTSLNYTDILDNIDGGSAATVYLPSQKIDGGGA